MSKPDRRGLRHVVCFTWKPGTSADSIAVLEAALDTLPALIPEIRGYRFGRDLGLAEGNAEFAIVGDFADADAWRRYQEHPEHQRVLAEHIRPNLARRVAVQLRLPAAAPGGA
jgi:Stress responsive A/B Barrel Domain